MTVKSCNKKKIPWGSKLKDYCWMFCPHDNELTWYSTTDKSQAFNFLSMKRLQNEKLCLFPLLSSKKRNRVLIFVTVSKKKTSVSAYSIIFQNTCPEISYVSFLTIHWYLVVAMTTQNVLPPLLPIDGSGAVFFHCEVLTVLMWCHNNINYNIIL